MKFGLKIKKYLLFFQLFLVERRPIIKYWPIFIPWRESGGLKLAEQLIDLMVSLVYKKWESNFDYLEVPWNLFLMKWKQLEIYFRLSWIYVEANKKWFKSDLKAFWKKLDPLYINEGWDLY